MTASFCGTECVKEKSLVHCWVQSRKQEEKYAVKVSLSINLLLRPIKHFQCADVYSIHFVSTITFQCQVSLLIVTHDWVNKTAVSRRWSLTTVSSEVHDFHHYLLDYRFTAANPSLDLSVMNSDFKCNNWILCIMHGFG